LHVVGKQNDDLFYDAGRCLIEILVLEEDVPSEPMPTIAERRSAQPLHHTPDACSVNTDQLMVPTEIKQSGQERV